MSNDETKKEVVLELNAKTLKRVDEAFAAMREEFTKRVPKRPAEELIKQKIGEIDEMAKLGAKLPQIFERLNKAVPLGISANSFAVYVRRIRKEIGSEFYTPRATTGKDETEATPAVKKEIKSEQKTNSEATKQELVLNCPECNNAKKISLGGVTIYRCGGCGSEYAANSDGSISEKKLN